MFVKFFFSTLPIGLPGKFHKIAMKFHSLYTLLKIPVTPTQMHVSTDFNEFD